MKFKSAIKRGRELILILHRQIHTKDYWLKNKDIINNNLAFSRKSKERRDIRSICFRDTVRLLGLKNPWILSFFHKQRGRII